MDARGTAASRRIRRVRHRVGAAVLLTATALSLCGCEVGGGPESARPAPSVSSTPYVIPTPRATDPGSAQRAVAATLSGSGTPVDGIRCSTGATSADDVPMTCVVDRGANRPQLTVRAAWHRALGTVSVLGSAVSTVPPPGAAGQSPEAAASAELLAQGLHVLSLSCAVPAPTTATCTATLTGGGSATVRVRLEHGAWRGIGVSG